MPATIEFDRLTTELPDLLSAGRGPLFIERAGQRVGVLLTPEHYDRLALLESVDESDRWTEEDYRDFSASSWALINRRLDEAEGDG